jgi:hypothetical protein
MVDTYIDRHDAASGSVAEKVPPQSPSRLAEALLGSVLVSLLLLGLLS